jgi:hypothetical protein
MVISNNEMYFLISNGVVVEPFVNFESFAECTQWMSDNRKEGEIAQWIKIIHCECKETE